MQTTLGQLLVNDALPEELRDYDRTLDKKQLNTLLHEVATRFPDRYPDIVKRLGDIGRRAAAETASGSFGAAHLTKAKAAQRYRQIAQQRLRTILAKPEIPDDKRHDMIVRALGDIQSRQADEVYQESLAENNPLAIQILSGARGNKANLNSLRGSDLLYADNRDRPLPIPVLHSYSEGVRPIEYWAGTYGARKSVIDVKMATARAGFLGKQLNQLAHRLMVVDEDDPREHKSPVGLPVDTDDPDNEGALLAADFGPYKRNMVLTPKVLRHLQALGHHRLLVRSPVTSRSPDGGIYARDAGIREYGTLPGKGAMTGFTAAQALAEPVSQGQLGSKHGGGIAGGTKAVSGFQAINQLVQVPKVFKGGAAHSEVDGRVERIEPAPAGGHYVWINGQQHYVSAGHELKVKNGDEVEAGDMISDGEPNPATITRHKGVGEGQRYFANALRAAMTDAGLKAHRRNTEVLARGLINHVRLMDEWADHLPDEVLPYSSVEHLYEPRDDHQVVTPDRAAGQYLERPVLHYTIGTKLRPSVLKDLKHFGVKEVAVHKDPPPFEPEMIRGMYSLHHDPDWMTRMYGSGLKTSLLDAAHRGSTSNESGTSFVPGLARGVDFGRTGTIKPPKPGTAVPIVEPKSEIKPMKKLGAATLIARMRKTADGTHQSNIGSSTVNSAGKTTDLGGQSGKVVPPESVAAKQPNVPGPLPATGPVSAVPNQTGAITIPKPPEPPKPPAPPGQVHPDRVQHLSGYYAPPVEHWQGQNPDAMNVGGYRPGDGLLEHFSDPASLASFVRGGAREGDLDSGFGGAFGALTRFGSLFDVNAMSTLTGGNPYVRGHYGNPDGQQTQQQGGGLGQGTGWTEPSLTDGEAPSAAPPVASPQSSPPTVGPRLSTPEAIQQVIGSGLGGEAAIRGVSGAGKLAVRSVTTPPPAAVGTAVPAAKATGAAGELATAEGVAAKGGAKAAAKGVGKQVLKKAPLLGWAIEGYEALDTSNEEALARMDAKMRGELPGITGYRGLDYFLDNALNIGQNLRSAYAGLDEAGKTMTDAASLGSKNDLNEAAMLELRLRNLGNDPTAVGRDASIAQAQQRLAEIYKSKAVAESAPVGTSMGYDVNAYRKTPGRSAEQNEQAYRQQVQAEMVKMEQQRRQQTEAKKIYDIYNKTLDVEQRLARGEDATHDFTTLDPQTRAMLEGYAKVPGKGQPLATDPAHQAAGIILALEQLHNARSGLGADAKPEAVRAAIAQAAGNAGKYYLPPDMARQFRLMATPAGAPDPDAQYIQPPDVTGRQQFLKQQSDVYEAVSRHCRT